MAEVTIYDLLSKMKALELLTKVNGFDRKFTWKSFSFHNYGLYGRNKRSSQINKTVDLLYKETKIKDFFPTLTRPKLKKLIEDFTRQTERKIKKKEERLELLKLRKYKRLLPLNEEKYKELGNRSEKWNFVVDVPIQLNRRGYYGNYFLNPFSDKVSLILYHLDEKKHNKPTDRELDYA